MEHYNLWHCSLLNCCDDVRDSDFLLVFVIVETQMGPVRQEEEWVFCGVDLRREGNLIRVFQGRCPNYASFHAVAVLVVGFVAHVSKAGDHGEGQLAREVLAMRVLQQCWARLHCSELRHCDSRSLVDWGEDSLVAVLMGEIRVLYGKS